MVIVLNLQNNHRRSHHHHHCNNNNHSPNNNHNKSQETAQTEYSKPLQDGKSKQEIDQISPVLQTNQKGIRVSLVDEEELSIFGRKIKKHYEDKNRKRSTDNKIHIFEISDCLRKALIMKQYPDHVKNTIY